MSQTSVFALQFVWFVIAWAVVAAFFVAPWVSRLHPDDALSVWLIPQLFRVLGVGLLVSNLAPEMPQSFAVPTALGDSLTAVLALTSVVALRRRWPGGRLLAWACSIVGVVDLAIALPHAARIEAARFLAAQWYVPALAVPLMIVSHLMTLRALLRNPLSAWQRDAQPASGADR
jgi:hypothetical protein